MKKLLFTVVQLLLTGILFSEEIVMAQKEILGHFKVGSGEGQVSYDSDSVGFYSPEGPAVDAEGQLWFFPSTTSNKIQIFNGKSLRNIPVPSYLPLSHLLNRQFNSQQGIVSNPSGYQFILKKNVLYYYNYYMKIQTYLNRENIYILPFGVLLEAKDKSQSAAVVLNPSQPDLDFSMISGDQLSTWLPTQPGGFTIGKDGLLYRNGMLWSVIQPKGIGGIYVGRLMSGHAIWNDGDRIRLVNARQEIEITVEAPWAKRNTPNFGLLNLGVGPWGELYYLIAPPHKPGINLLNAGGGESLDYYYADPAFPAEIVVVRNHLKYFGRLNDGGVRLRKEPTTTGAILGTYPNKTGFRILETGTKEETIGGQKNVWYKVRLLDGTEGWFFGAFVHNLYDGPNSLPPPWPNVPDW